jgi:hypothetical protein
MIRESLVDDHGEPLVTLHGLRHTGASIALAGGVALTVVSRQLGHARVDITAKVYAHMLDDRPLDAFGAAHERTAPCRANMPADWKRPTRRKLLIPRPPVPTARRPPSGAVRRV